MTANTAFAQDVTEQSGPAKINWTTKQMVFTGDGAANLNAPNAASARIGAERAAELVALRNALEALKGVKIKAGMTVDDKLKAEPSLTAEVEGVIRGFIVKETRYYSDGGVQRDLAIPLDGELGQLLLKTETAKVSEKPAAPAEPAKPAEAEKPANQPSTGLVVVAQGFKLTPVLAPIVLDEEGKTVYAAEMVENRSAGVASYSATAQNAAADKKVAGNPLVVQAKSSPNGVDVVVSNADATKIREAAQKAPFLKEGRVIIVKQ